MRVFRSSSRDVHENLAWEEHLLDFEAGAGEPILAFTVNDRSVVLGRNQNAWREVRHAVVRRAGLRVARRLSGGGTVYHDAGNLNYSLMLPRAVYQRDRIFDLVLRGLAACGVSATRSGTHSLVTGGRKFSGSAFCFRRDLALHHGTLLLAADLAALQDCLTPSLPGVATTAVASVPAPVVNLGEVVPGLQSDHLQAALVEALAAGLDSPARLGEIDADWIAAADRHRSWDWVYGQSPAFSVPLDGGTGPVTCTVREGRIIALDGPAPAQDQVLGLRFGAEVVAAVRTADDPTALGWWETALAEVI